jgi:hypothetical protein
MIGEPGATTITVPASITQLTPDSFNNPEWIEAVTFEPGSRISFLGNSTFGFFESLRSICIPASVEVLGHFCFMEANSDDPWCPLESITFEPGSKLTEIKPHALIGCHLLQSIYLPASVQTLCGASFTGCGLTLIEFDPENEDYHSIADCVMDCMNTTLIHYFGTAPEMRVLDEVEVIDDSACYDWGTISSVGFGPASKLSLIGEYAFRGCDHLESICIPGSVEELDEGCFIFCESLANVSFCSGSKLRVIGSAAFQSCSALVSIALPASLEVLGAVSFCNCERLETVTFPPDSKLTRLEHSAFEGCGSLRSICLPSSTVCVDKECFGECYALSTLTFSSPCNLRTLLDLPPYSPAVIAIPDTVEELGFSFCAEPPGLLTLTFGRDSKLSHLHATRDPALRFTRCFLRVTTTSLKVLRCLMEFEIGAISEEL